MPERVLLVELGLDATDEDILDQMRVMKRCREDRSYDNIVCVIRGFSNDPRELYAIPEAQAYCKRLVSLGFISYLDFWTFLNSKTSELARIGWGASEVWLCAEGRLKRQNVLTRETVEELWQAVLRSNHQADATLGPMLRDELDFDLSGLNDPHFKEDAVREDIIAPLLRKAGYKAAGLRRMERSKPLTHPYVMIGSKRHKINIVPDYTLYDEHGPLMVLEAKAPNEPIVRSVHVEQAYSYAIHPDVRCMDYALCNGRELAFYHISKPEPLFVIDCGSIRARWDEVAKHLLPQFLRMPELRNFHADFGLQVKQLGLADEEEITFNGVLLGLVSKSSELYYVANATCNLGGLECMITFDFSQDVLALILRALPQPQAEQVLTALARMPFSIEADAKIRVHWKAHLGKPIAGVHEEFIPFVVTEVSKVEYDPSLSVGRRDPAAVQAGVPVLQV